MGNKSRAKKKDFKLDQQQQEAEARHAAEVKRIQAETSGLKKGLVSATEDYDTDVVQDRAVADYMQNRPKLSLYDAEKGHLTGYNKIEGLTSTLLGGYIKGKDEKFGAQLNTVSALAGSSDIGAKGMNYLAKLKSDEILGKAQRNMSDYQSKLGTVAKITGAYAGSAIENKTWTPWKG